MKLLGRVRLGARLGAAFGVLVAALLIVAAVGVTSLQALDSSGKDSAQGKNLRATADLETIGQIAQGSGYVAARHLYVLDGDLKAQDELAEHALADWKELNEKTEELHGNL